MVHVDAGILSNADFTIFMLRASTETILRGVFCVVVEALIFNSIGAHWGVLLFAVFLTVAYFVHSMFGQCAGAAIAADVRCGKWGDLFFIAGDRQQRGATGHVNPRGRLLRPASGGAPISGELWARPPSFSFPFKF